VERVDATMTDLSRRIAELMEPLDTLTGKPIHHRSHSPLGWWTWSRDNDGNMVFTPVSHHEPDRVVWMLKWLIKLDGLAILPLVGGVRVGLVSRPAGERRAMFAPEFGETLMSMRLRISELQQARATLQLKALNVYVDRRIVEIQEEIDKLEADRGA